MGFDCSTGSQDLGTGCGYGKENGLVVWCVYYSVFFQSFDLRHLVIAPFRNTKKLLVVSMQSRFDTSRFDTNSSGEILGEYICSLSQVHGTIYPSN